MEGVGILFQVSLTPILVLHVLAWGIKEWTFQQNIAYATSSASKCVY